VGPAAHQKLSRCSADAPKAAPLVPKLPLVNGAVAAWAPGGDGVMLFDSSTGRLQWVQPSGENPAAAYFMCNLACV